MVDAQIQTLITQENKRQSEGIELIPSENYASSAIRKILSSSFVNKYSEGYPGKRYYGGNENVDIVENLAQARARKLFSVAHVNVQPYSGSPANLAVYLATCQPGDMVMGQALTAGGHLTHGYSLSATGIFYKTVNYGLKSKTEKNDTDLFDYDEIRKLAHELKPRLIWVGATAYPLLFHYEKFAEIADEVDAYLAADIAHVAGLIAGGVHPTPVPHVHIVTTTTHKSLRGPRGAMIMTTEKGLKKDPGLPQKIDRAVFPGLQGGPHDNQTAAIATALYEAGQPEFTHYAKQIVKNASCLAHDLIKGGLTLVGNGTQNHLILVDLTRTLGVGSGIFAQSALDMVGLTLNKNTVPAEKSSPFYPSGIRLGTPAATTRGMKEKEMHVVADIMLTVINLLKRYSLPVDKDKRKIYLQDFFTYMKNDETIKSLRNEVVALAKKFPIP